jgi:hypothetical protein
VNTSKVVHLGSTTRFGDNVNLFDTFVIHLFGIFNLIEHFPFSKPSHVNVGNKNTI